MVEFGRENPAPAPVENRPLVLWTGKGGAKNESQGKRLNGERILFFVFFSFIQLYCMSSMFLTFNRLYFQEDPSENWRVSDRERDNIFYRNFYKIRKFKVA